MYRNRIGIAARCRRAWILFVLLAPLSRAQDEVKDAKKKHPFMTNAKEIEAGGKLFAASCAVCHGVRAQGGRGPNLVQRYSWHPLDDEALFKTIKDGVPSAGMPAARVPEDDLWRLTAFVRSLTSPAAETPVTGDPTSGESLYWGKGGCSGCHRIRGRGGPLGPDLTNVGATRPLALIREALLDPDADGWQNYQSIKVVLKDGSTLQGVARNRNNYSIQIQDAQGKVHLVQVGDVKEMELGRSPMPKDFEKRLSPQEIDDLLAYLSRQSIRPPEPKPKTEQK